MADKINSFSVEQKMNSAVVDEKSEAENQQQQHLIENAILRLNGNILGIVLGIVVGLVIFAATNWLVIKGGRDVGAHLGLLSQFYIGYSVSFTGSLIGAIYGFATGYVIGFLTAWIYNWIVVFKKHN